MKIKTLFISDVHLGTSKCQADKLLQVLKDYEYGLQTLPFTNEEIY